MISLSPPRPSFLPSTPPAAQADVYSDLLSGTRRLSKERRALRDAWYEGLTRAGEGEDILFDFEITLKATACFSNPRNHPGPPHKRPVVAQDFRGALGVFADGLARAVDLARKLLGERDRAFVFHRYLETLLPEDQARARLLTGGSQATPEESLMTLRQGLTGALEVTEGVLRAPRVPFRLFHAVLATAYREVDRNTFFNPLSALEFRPEFDRIKSAQVLELIRAVPGVEAQRLVALTFLSLFRMLRYLSLLEQLGADSARRRAAGSAYLVLSVLRSDGRALSDHLRQRAGVLLAESFERELLRVRASDLRRRSPALRAGAHRLIEIKSTLDGIAGNLRLELRRAFHHDLPEPGAVPPDELFRALGVSLNNLRPALQNAVLFLGRSLGASLERGGVFDDHTARRETSARLRRDVWMFAQIVRAFSTKAQHSAAEDRWTPAHNFQYVREFLAYFRAMGYPLLRAGDYPRIDAFMAAMRRLEDTDLVDPARIETAIDECMAFHGFLTQLFDDIGKRDELVGVPFDRRAAAGALKLYLGE